MKKKIVLFVLFVLPLVTYLFFASGVNSFVNLPNITKNIPDINTWKTIDDKPVALTNKITILGFIGTDVEKRKGSFFRNASDCHSQGKNSSEKVSRLSDHPTGENPESG